MVVAYDITPHGHSIRNNGHLKRYVEYVDSRLKKKHKLCRVTEKGKVKSTCYGGLDEKTHKPKAKSLESAIKKQKAINAPRKAKAKTTQQLLYNKALRRIDGTAEKYAERSMWKAAKSKAETMRTFIDKYGKKKKVDATTPPQSSGFNSPPVSAGPSSYPSRAPSPPPFTPAPVQRKGRGRRPGPKQRKARAARAKAARQAKK